jgi:hypothetical protein
LGPELNDYGGIQLATVKKEHNPKFLLFSYLFIYLRQSLSNAAWVAFELAI